MPGPREQSFCRPVPCSSPVPNGSDITTRVPLPLYQRHADARRLQQRLVTFSLISRGELAYDAKPGSPENPREPRPEAGASLVSEKAGVVRYGPHIATDPTLLWSMSRGRSRGQSNDGPIGQGGE